MNEILNFLEYKLNDLRDVDLEFYTRNGQLIFPRYGAGGLQAGVYIIIKYRGVPVSSVSQEASSIDFTADTPLGELNLLINQAVRTMLERSSEWVRKTKPLPYRRIKP